MNSECWRGVTALYSVAQYNTSPQFQADSDIVWCSTCSASPARVPVRHPHTLGRVINGADEDIGRLWTSQPLAG